MHTYTHVMPTAEGIAQDRGGMKSLGGGGGVAGGGGWRVVVGGETHSVKVLQQLLLLGLGTGLEEPAPALLVAQVLENRPVNGPAKECSQKSKKK